MKYKSFIKYSIRFLTLQIILTFITIYYFDNFLIPSNDYRIQIDANLLEDKNRFFVFISDEFVKVDIFLGIFIFLFLIFLYSTKFYTYVNELSFSLDRNFFDEYFSIFLTWTTSLIAFLTFFRFTNLISRGYLILLLFIIPIILLLFRNTELISVLFGRSVTNEKYITINLEQDSVFRNLRIMTFRKKLEDFNSNDPSNFEEISSLIDAANKEINLNLIVVNLGHLLAIDQQLESYLINLNKKILIISKNKIQFNKLFLSRKVQVSGYQLVYFNNDIQYGSKYILKRILDIVLATTLLVFFSPFLLGIYIYILYLDNTPAVIKQNRVGLHGKLFKMYKFRTMKNNSHELREDLEELNAGQGPLFKIKDDPRLISGARFIRNYSLDELPQLINVIKGDMSMVGPRPLFKEDTQLFDKSYMRRLNVLPGLTGLLQINERNTDEFEIWYRYDMEYIDNWSLLMDMKIILKTPFSMFNSKTKGL
ncbi:sugar transferase [Acidimicrobiia bacterium]|nr:sugar transferase [Acidimicrobiia bacterium]